MPITAGQAGGDVDVGRAGVEVGRVVGGKVGAGVDVSCTALTFSVGDVVGVASVLFDVVAIAGEELVTVAVTSVEDAVAVGSGLKKA